MDVKMNKQLTKVVNASGRMTKLGVSTQSKKVQEAMLEASDSYYIMDELYENAGHRIAQLCKANDAVVTNSASSAIAMVTASLIAKDNHNLIVNLHKTRHKLNKREVILPKGHAIDYGVPINTMIELGGGLVIEAGSTNLANKREVESYINENTMALLYVKSHHTVQKNMISISEMIELGQHYNIPVIIDAAAEENMISYFEMGADFVIYSGTKAICAPTSGFVLCKSSEQAKNMRLQYYGIGRAMKIGKENIFGLVAALEEYMTKKAEPIVKYKDLEKFVESINQIEGLEATIVQDESGRDIFRASIKIYPGLYGMTAIELNKKLKKENPAIFCRDYLQNQNILVFDTRPLSGVSQLKYILEKLQSF